MFEFNYKINYLNLKLSINIDFYDKSDKEALVHNQIHEERIKYATEYNEDKINFLKKTPTPLIESIDVDDLFDLKYLF